jgi:hypothetical protein
LFPGLAIVERKRAEEVARRLELLEAGAIENPREYDLAKHSVILRQHTPREAAERFCAPRPLA